MIKDTDSIIKEATERDKTFLESRNIGLIEQSEFESLRDRNFSHFKKDILESVGLSTYRYADIVFHVASGQAGMEFNVTADILQDFSALLEAILEQQDKDKEQKESSLAPMI